MNKRIVPLLLLVAGCVALLRLQREKAATEVTPRPLLYLVADTQREAERIPLRMTRVSDADEVKEGQRIARGYGLTLRQPANDDERTILQYVSNVGLQVASHVQRTDIPYHFYIEDGLVDAYALPGGHIVVGRGMLQLLESEDELAMVLGHEIAHVDNRHAIQHVQYEIASRRVGLEDIYQLGRPAVEIFEVGYTKEQELEADRAGLDLIVAAGYSPVAAVNVMDRLGKLEQEYGPGRTAQVEEMVSVPIRALQEYFRSHPPAAERRAALQAQIASRSWSTSATVRPLGVRYIFLTDSGEQLDLAGNFANSTRSFQQALDLAPRYERAWRGMARARWRAGDGEGAFEAVSHAIQMAPRDQDWILAARGLSVPGAANPVERFITMEKSVAGGAAPGDTTPAIELAGLKLVRAGGSADELRAALALALGLANEANARAEAGWWLYKAGRPADAEAQLEIAHQAVPQEPATSLLLVWVLSDLKREADAQQLLVDRQMLFGLAAPLAAERQAARAVIDWRTGSEDKAKVEFQLAARADAVWMSPGWVKNMFTDSTASVIRQLQIAETARRTAELQQRQRNETLVQH